ncbi:hypothetical protein SAMN05444008_104159 [Cnuella takakiae]|uniref:Por secretion system C-terminal sorting domain-containing protein n=1 Tax=Cnuella takakiae TaxID=1302690 RepID=A0A1M4Y5A4_9BACT|nr:hypothetical protein [Cnuella takakiae]OLY93052.1 hypothetical protein BUE76_14975 [Cnuella takakiae]SHF00888.1 hypothetical protein SAMN05444008_104159 [Cnuella takakiae]
MRAFTIYTSLFLISLLFGRGAKAQPGIYIPEGAQVFLASDTASFFADVVLRGNLGIGRNGVVNFTGRQWLNYADARISDANRKTNDSGGNSGSIRFAATLWRQQLSGGFNAATQRGPVLAQLILSNPLGVNLLESATKVAHTLELQRGLFYLNGQTFVMGHKQPGSIKGYDEEHFLVTGDAPGSGTLVREGLQNRLGPVVFPLGTGKGGYAPLAVRLLSDEPDDFAASLFNQVRSNGVNGFILFEQTVNKTWELGKLNRPGIDAVQVSLQHQLRDGGDDYLRNQERAFVSLYKNNNWDTVSPSLASKGVLVSGKPLANAATHTRVLVNGIGEATYFTKMALPDTTRRMALDLYGYRIDAGHTHIGWGVQPERNVHSYIVQRWFSNNSSRVAVDTLASKASNRFSNNHLYYQTTDNNNYPGITYYQLRIRYLDGSEGYSEVIAIAGIAGQLDMHLWPNPTPDYTYLSISTAMPVKNLVIWDMLGQKLYEEDIAGRRIIRLNLKPFAQTMFVVGIISPAGKLLASEKVIRQIQ